MEYPHISQTGRFALVLLGTVGGGPAKPAGLLYQSHADNVNLQFRTATVSRVWYDVMVAKRRLDLRDLELRLQAKRISRAKARNVGRPLISRRGGPCTATQLGG